MSWPASAAYPALAGIVGAGTGADRDEARVWLERAFGPDVDPDLLSEGPLVVARTPATQTARHKRDRVVSVLAGRIHNIEDVAARAGLVQQQADEDVLASAFEREGEYMLEKLSGSFVLVVWDRREGTGRVIVDQLGASCVYYCTWGSRLLFASEIFLLLRMLPRRPSPEPTVVIRMVASARPPVEMTLYEGIKRVTAGHLLEIADGRWERRRYWSPRYRPPVRRSLEELGEERWAALNGAVSSRIGPHDRVGIIMSGGLDSSAVAAAATNLALAPGHLRGYSAVFPDRPQVDESPRIELLARHLGLPSLQIEVHPQGAFALGFDYLSRWALPSPGPGHILERPLVEQARADGVTVLLDGQGGDEVFGFSPYLAADRVRRGRILSSVGLVRRFPYGQRAVPRRKIAAVWRRYAVKGAMPYAVHRFARRLHGPGRYAPELLTAASGRVFFESDDPWEWKRTPGPRWWAYKDYLTTRVWDEGRVPEYLRHRATMAGLEARPPLMDVDLVAHGLATPPELEFSRSFDRPILREGLRDRVPDNLRLWSQKSNLASIYHRSYVADFDAVRRILAAEDAEIRAFVSPHALGSLLERPLEIGEPAWMSWGTSIWSLMSVECWLRQQADGFFAERTLASGAFRAPAAALHSAQTG